MRRLVVATSILLFSAAALFAQVRETVNVNYVEVPVTVVDSGGNPVRGLTKDRFELLDQGKAREITSFDTIDFASPQSMKSTSVLNPALRRSFLLLFDLTFSSPVGRAKAQEAALNFVARGMKRYDLAAIGTVDVDRGFRVITSFTTDRNLLAAAIGNPATFRAADPLQIAGQLDVDLGQQPPGQQQQASRSDKDIQFDSVNAEIAREQTRMNERFYRSRIDREVKLLEGLARTMRMLPGRKQVVFFSEGFDPRLIEGRDAQQIDETMQENQQVEAGEVWKIDMDLRYGNISSLKLVDELAAACRASDVVLNAVDIKGVRVNNSIEKGAVINSNAGLFLLSRPTGGEVFHNSNDLNADLEHMLRSQEVVYVLGFQPPVTQPGKFHGLRVRVKDLSGAHVSYRTGYYEHGSENALERTLTAAQIILNDIPQTDIGVAALAAPFPTAGKPQVPVILEINGADLVKDAKTSTINVEIYLYAFDDDGLVRDRMFQVIGLDLGKVGDKLRDSGIKYYGTLSLPEGKYTIRSLVHVRETDRKGYARADIAVPSVNDVAVLPPFFVEQAGKWLMVKGSSHDRTNAGYPFQIGGDPFIPSAAVRMRRGEAREFALFVYNVTPDELAWETNVADSNGTEHAVTAKLLQETHGNDVTKLVLQYSPDDRDSAPERLDVTIHKKGSSDERKVSVPITLLRPKGEIR
ncbi:MAG TPA: VWA domain-containing protein [Thermoanaerobaculia bacterium]